MVGGGLCHLQHLNVTEVVSSMAAESRVNQYSIQPVDLGFPLTLRHEGPQVQILGIFNILIKMK